MAAPQNPKPSLECQLDALRSVGSIHSAQQILKSIEQRVRRQQRQAAATMVGACVSAFAVAFFAWQGHLFAFITLMLTTAAFVYSVWKSARNTASLASLKTGDTLLSAWRTARQQQLHHTLIARGGMADS